MKSIKVLEFYKIVFVYYVSAEYKQSTTVYTSFKYQINLFMNPSNEKYLLFGR